MSCQGTAEEKTTKSHMKIKFIGIASTHIFIDITRKEISFLRMHYPKQRFLSALGRKEISDNQKEKS